MGLSGTFSRIRCLFVVATASVFVLFSSPALADSAVEGVRVWRAPDNTRLVFDLSTSVEHKIFELSNPSRLVIDIESADFAADIEGIELADTPVQGIRTSKQDDDGLRVVLDLKTSIKPRSFSLEPNDDYGHRLVVDLFDEHQVSETSINDVVENDRDIVIVIDAGHGGQDPGAIGPGKVVEKDVVMAISNDLAAMINGHTGYKAELVRSGDYFVSLTDRPKLAREKRADFFISIHADAFNLSSVSGASVYALSGKGAVSARNRYAADRENRSDLIGGSGDLSLKDKDDQLADLLLDLSMNATMDSSLKAGNAVLSQISSVTKLHKKSVEQKGFAVLKSPDMPSLLIETGFISNPYEAKQLSSKNFQEKMARAIFNGIRSYFADNPPAGTLIAARGDSDPLVYQIKSGDTLSEIASRYNVSLASLKAANRIDGSVIRIGQELQIPNT